MIFATSTQNSVVMALLRFIGPAAVLERQIPFIKLSKGSLPLSLLMCVLYFKSLCQIYTT
jgi:hypothetical protein